MKRAFFLLAISLSVSFQVNGQLLVKGEFRPRFEFRSGYGKILAKDDSPTGFVSQRSRLMANFQDGIFTYALSIQDVMVWGDEDFYSSTGVFGSKASIDINEAWIGIQAYPKGMLRIGRQYLAYEDQRILSRRGWNQSELKYDALLFQHKCQKFQIDVALSWNSNVDGTTGIDYDSDKMKSLDFIYLKKDFNDWLYVSAMALASGFTATDTTSEIYWSGTYAAYLSWNRKPFSGLASAFYQNGKNRKGFDLQAYMFSLSADYRINEFISAGAGVDYLSGQDQKETNPEYQGKTHSFDNLYGGRHKFYGHLDLFNNLSKSTSDGGLIDIFLKIIYRPVEKVSIGADFHFFSLQNNTLDKSSAETTYLSKGLGRELDLNASWEISKVFNLTGGYSFFLLTDSMEKIQGLKPGTSRFPSWVWLMITAKPVFFESKK